jgi:hypothetical protein
MSNTVLTPESARQLANLAHRLEKNPDFIASALQHIANKKNE